VVHRCVIFSRHKLAFIFWIKALSLSIEVTTKRSRTLFLSHSCLIKTKSPILTLAVEACSGAEAWWFRRRIVSCCEARAESLLSSCSYDCWSLCKTISFADKPRFRIRVFKVSTAPCNWREVIGTFECPAVHSSVQPLVVPTLISVWPCQLHN